MGHENKPDMDRVDWLLYEAERRDLGKYDVTESEVLGWTTALVNEQAPEGFESIDEFYVFIWEKVGSSQGTEPKKKGE